MSIPIKDISAGDTVSSMVDKINYNFDLLSLKGGGPAGIQGIQGIRGSIGLQGCVGQQGAGGSMIYDVEPINPQNYNEGDMTLWGNAFYLLKDVGGTKDWVQVLNISSQIETPFVGTQFNTINPKSSDTHDYSLDTFVIGINNEDLDNSSITSNASNVKSALVISGEKFNNTGKRYHISLIGETANYITPDGRIYIDYDNGMPVMKLEGDNNGSVRLVGGVGSNAKYIDVGNDIKLSNRTSSLIGNDNAIVVTDKNGNVMNSVDWIVSSNASNKRLYPLSNYDIGQDANRIGDIYVKQGCQINILDANYATNNSFFKVTYKDNSNAQKNICTMSSYGVSFGIDGTATSKHCDDGTHFGIRIGNTSRPTTTGYNKSPHISLVTNSLASAFIASESSSVSIVNYLDNLTTVNQSVAYTFQLTGNSYDDSFIKKQYSPLITLLVDTGTNNAKKTGNTLWISGADSDVTSPSAGKDVVISGGNTFGFAMQHVGGNVFISGGNSITSTTTLSTNISGDLRRMGNIIMGINPIYHKSLLSDAVYSADVEYKKLTGTNPEGVEFFDINDIAMHANRIVIDSNANYRKGCGVNKYGKQTPASVSQNHSFSGPYVKKAELSTVQVSGINTLKTTRPVILKPAECCEHQFLSGVLSQVFKITKPTADSAMEVSEGSLTGNRYLAAHSVYLVVDQIWQKVGNVVNVNLRAQWLASDGTHINTNGVHQRTTTKYDGLYHVYDYMFGYSNPWKNNQTYANISYFNGPNAHLRSPELTKWWNVTLNTSSGLDSIVAHCTAKNYALSTIVSGQTDFYEQFANGMNAMSNLYCNMYEGYHNIHTPSRNSNLSNQPICMFTIPFSIENCYVSSIYGNGNVGTENINGYFHNKYSENENEKAIIELEPSNAFAESGNIIVGDGCLSSATENTQWGQFGSYRSLNNVSGNLHSYTGMNGVYHGIYGEFGDPYQNPNNTYLEYPHTKSHMTDDGRMNMSNSDNVWNENRFIKPIPMSNTEYDKYTYFFPQKLTKFGNTSYYANNLTNNNDEQKVFTPYECYRPIIGLFTTMNINYSYVLLPKLSDNFIGMSYQEPSVNIGTVTGTVTPIDL